MALITTLSTSKTIINKGSATTEVIYYKVTVFRPGDSITKTLTTSTIGDSTSLSRGTSSGVGGFTSNPASRSTSSSPTSSNTSSTSKSSSAPPISTTVPANSSGGFSSGDLAGAAVGCLIGGALIAFLIAFLLFGKRRSRGAISGRNYTTDDPKNRQHLLNAAEKPPTRSTEGGEGWVAYLPQSADDRAIQSAVGTFFQQVELHVDNFYHKDPADLKAYNLQGLTEIDSGELPGRIDRLMQDPSFVLPVIKHCIAALLITRMSPRTRPGTSLLPANMAAYPERLRDSKLASSERRAAHQAYSQWRHINTYLFPRAAEDPAYKEERDIKADEIGAKISKAFAAWQPSEGYKAEMYKNQKSLVATAANLGIVIMSQPSAFEFKWNADRNRSDVGHTLVILPAFRKMTDEQGRPLSNPQQLVSPTILRV